MSDIEAVSTEHDHEILNKIKSLTNANAAEDFQITNKDIRKAINLLKNNKAPGSDAITAEALKAGGENIVNILDKVFNKIMETEDIPADFSKMLVTPIH